MRKYCDGIMIGLPEDKNSNKALKNAIRLLSSDGLDGAMMLVERELEIDPESSEAWGAKGDIFYLQGLYRSAVQCSEKSIYLDPKNALAWNTKGNALYKLGRYDEAIECYNRAIEIEPLFVRSWYNKKLAVDIEQKKLRPKVHYLSARESSMKKQHKDR